MGKNVLILMGSPRKNGNTMLMTESFTNGAQEAGHTVTRLDVAKMKFDGCQNCMTCWSKGRACSMDDDFVKIAPQLEKCDVVVFAAPMYWSFFPSQMKAIIDRLYAYIVPPCKTPLDGKKLVMLTCGDGPDEHAFDMIVPWYKGIAEYMKWEDGGYVGVPTVMMPGDIKKTNGLDKAYELGKSL